MLEHTKRQVHKWKFLQHALSGYVYNRSLFDIFTPVVWPTCAVNKKRLITIIYFVMLKSIPKPGRSLHQTATPGVMVWRRGLSGPRRRLGPRRQSSGRRERNDKDQFERPPTTSVPAAIKTATQELGFWVTQEPVDTDALTIASSRRGWSHFVIYEQAIPLTFFLISTSFIRISRLKCATF